MLASSRAADGCARRCRRDFDEPRADFSGGRLKRVARIEDRDQLRNDDILAVVQMALRQSETVGSGDQECSTEVLAPTIDLTDQYVDV